MKLHRFPKRGETGAIGLTGTLGVLAGVLAVTFVVILGFRLFSSDSSTGSQSATAVLSRSPEVVISSAAKEATLAFLDVDYRDMDPRLTKVLSLATGTFYSQYKSREATLKAAALQGHAISVGTVKYVGLAQIGADSARAYVAADSTVTHTPTTGSPKVADEMHSYRFQVDLSRIKGQWLVNDLKFV
jgi:Mce-associated membrane protein